MTVGQMTSGEKADAFALLADDFAAMEQTAREHRRPWDHYVRAANVCRRWSEMYREGATAADVFGPRKT